MPKQIIRLLIAFALFVSLFIVVKHFLVPASFGDIGHYRANSIKENADHPVKFIGSAVCATCHEAIDTTKASGKHKGLACESCHGPGYQHDQDPSIKLFKPGTREFCGRCHSKNSTRPDFIMQQDLKEHNPDNKCIECHNPHNPWL